MTGGVGVTTGGAGAPAAATGGAAGAGPAAGAGSAGGAAGAGSATGSGSGSAARAAGGSADAAGSGSAAGAPSPDGSAGAVRAAVVGVKEFSVVGIGSGVAPTPGAAPAAAAIAPGRADPAAPAPGASPSWLDASAEGSEGDDAKGPTPATVTATVATTPTATAPAAASPPDRRQPRPAAAPAPTAPPAARPRRPLHPLRRRPGRRPHPRRPPRRAHRPWRSRPCRPRGPRRGSSRRRGPGAPGRRRRAGDDAPPAPRRRPRSPRTRAGAPSWCAPAGSGGRPRRCGFGRRGRRGRGRGRRRRGDTRASWRRWRASAAVGAERLADGGVRQAAHLVQHQGRALTERQRGDVGAQLADLLAHLGRSWTEPATGSSRSVSSSTLGPGAHQVHALVVRDPEEPRPQAIRGRGTRRQRPVGGEHRQLEGLLRVLRVAHERRAVTEDLRAVALVEHLEGALVPAGDERRRGRCRRGTRSIRARAGGPGYACRRGPMWSALGPPRGRRGPLIPHLRNTARAHLRRKLGKAPAPRHVVAQNPSDGRTNGLGTRFAPRPSGQAAEMRRSRP